MKQKTFYGFLAIILAAVIVIVCGVGSSWFTNKDFKTWFNGWGQGVEKDTDDENGGDVIQVDNFILSADNEDGGIATFSATPLDEEDEWDGILRIILEPANAIDTFTWSSSGEAVELEVSEDTRSAKVNCLHAFGVQIIITATSDINEDVKATATCDYVKRVSSVAVNLKKNDTDFDIDKTVYFSEDGIVHSVFAVPHYGLGTITPEFIVDGGELTSNIVVPSDITGLSTLHSLTFTGGNFTLKTPFETFYALEDLGGSMIGGGGSLFPGNSGIGLQSLGGNAAEINEYYFDNCGGDDGYLCINWHTEYNGKQYEVGVNNPMSTLGDKVKFDLSFIYPSADNAGFEGDGNIVF